MRNVKSSILLFFLFQQLLLAQQLNYTILNTNKGLPSSEVYAILQDKQGYMWFATNQGVARYDGKKFTTYTIADGLVDNTVFRMCEDTKGRIWFASQSVDLCYWEKGIIHKSVASELLHKKVISAYIVNGLYVDSSDNVWVNTIQQLLCIESKNNYTTCKQIQFNNSTSFAHLILIDEKKLMLNSQNVSIYTFIKSSKGYTLEFNFHKNNEPNNIQVFISKNKLNVPIEKIDGAVSRTSIFYIFIDDLLFTIEKGKEIKLKKMPHKIISLNIDQNNDLWVGYRRAGVACYKNCNLDSAPLSLYDEYSVDDVCVDHEGGVWIATLEKGVLYVPSTSIIVYSNLRYLKDHITFIGAVDDQIFLNTYNNAICRKKDQTFVLDECLCELGKKKSSLFYMARFNDTTYLSFSHELVRLVPSPLFLRTGAARSAFSGGKMIFSTADKAVWYLYGSGIKKINNQKDTSEMYNLPARTTCALPYGNDILVGSKKGLYLFRKGEFSNLGTLDTLLLSQISGLTEAPENSIWIATTGNGVLRLKNNKVIQLTEKDGLISNVCTAITIDQYKNVWVGTNKGLSCITPFVTKQDKWLIKNVTEQNGLNSNEITKLFASQNTLHAGTMAGLNSIDIKEIIGRIPPSSAYIQSIKVNGKEQHLHLPTTIFPHNENNFMFTLNGVTFKDNGDHLYRYRLIGMTDNWQQTTSDELLLNNLKPGNYIFEVQVANKDMIWSKNSASYSFTIDKPFWLTWWFILLEIIILIAIIYLIISLRTSMVRKKEQEKLRINKLLAEYQMKALTAQMNPHFIFNAINSIQNFIIQNHSTLAYDYLIKFSKLIRLVLNNSKDNEVSIAQELETLDLYIELEQLRFENSFEYQLKIDPQVDTASLLIPGLLLQPFIENAIWHGLMPLKNGKGIISLTIIIENEFLKIIITDNGVGRTASGEIKKKIVHKNHQSVGMELTGKRIELFGKESKFSLQIIDNYDDNKKSTGTTVEIILPMIEMY